MRIGILSNNDSNEATFRMTIKALFKSLKELGHEVIDSSQLTSYPDVLFTMRHINPNTPEVSEFIIDCKDNNVKICVYINDVYSQDDLILQKWASLADIIFTPTEYHKLFIESICSNRVEILPDSVDYLMDIPIKKEHKEKKILDTIWFGSPESYSKSMSKYNNTINELIGEKKINYTILSKLPNIPENWNHIEFNSSTFIREFSKFDLCILSHTPLDYNINTFVKSPNKLALAVSLGVPCIASRTPSYRKELEDCGLGEYCFSDENEFKSNILKLMNHKERNLYLNKSQDTIIKKYNYKNLGKIFLYEINKN
tara:strand:+ start:219 stop:1157 length:939 start_codon:yes stop_codon:yes gene_type:complete